MKIISWNVAYRAHKQQSQLNALISREPDIMRVYGVLKYNKSYIIFAACPGHYGYNFKEQFITSLPEEILYKQSFLILKKLGGDMKSDIARSDPLMLGKMQFIILHPEKPKQKTFYLYLKWRIKN